MSIVCTNAQAKSFFPLLIADGGGCPVFCLMLSFVSLPCYTISRIFLRYLLYVCIYIYWEYFLRAQVHSHKLALRLCCWYSFFVFDVYNPDSTYWSLHKHTTCFACIDRSYYYQLLQVTSKNKFSLFLAFWSNTLFQLTVNSCILLAFFANF